MSSPKKFGPKTHWTDDEIEVLRKLAKEKSSLEIADILGRTNKSVQGKAHRLGISLDNYSVTIICVDCGRKRYVSPQVSNAVRCKNCQATRDKQLRFEKQPERADKKYFDGNKHLALERDGFRCRLCGDREDLVVHHINEISYHNSTEPDSSLDNLTTLCLSCHSSYHRNKKVRESRIKEDDVCYGH